MIKKILSFVLLFILFIGFFPSIVYAKESKAYKKYQEAMQATIVSGSWTERLAMTADMALSNSGTKIKTKASITSEMEISNYDNNDLSKLKMSGFANMSIMNQTYAWDMVYENGVTHYNYTEPDQSSVDLATDPDYFDFNTMTEDMMTKTKVSGNKISFTIPGEKMEEAGIAAVNMMQGIHNLYYGDIDVEVVINEATGIFDKIVMTFHASLEYQGYDAEVDYHIDYTFTRDEYSEGMSKDRNEDMTITQDSEETSPKLQDGLVIYSDHSNLNIQKDAIITLSAGIVKDGELHEDISGITFQIDDSSILKLSDTGVEDSLRYVKLKAMGEGTTEVLFHDTTTNDMAKMMITVYENKVHSYTLTTVPSMRIEKDYNTNFYNVNGLYIDCYQYEIEDDKSAVVSFDVYNTNYSYGIVEVYDQDGHLKNAVLIDKMNSSNTSIKEAVWDNMNYLIRDCFQKTMFTYRQESGFSKKTPGVTVEIPPNGYIKISTDPTNSSIVGIVNYADLLISILQLSEELINFDINSKAFSEKLTEKLLNEKIFAELVIDNEKIAQSLWKNIGKESLITQKAMGNFIDTANQNLSRFDLMDVILETVADCGGSIGENVFKDLSGPYGKALDIMFLIGKAENIALQYHDTTHNADVGSIYIQNQGGGLRSCQQIKVESDHLTDDTALSAYSITLDSGLLDMVKDVNPDIYKSIKNGTTYTYNISLLKDGKETQPNGKVIVSIPIPDDLKILAYTGIFTDKIIGKINVYRVEDDGNLTKMDVKIKDDSFVFETDHFSIYAVVGNTDAINTVITVLAILFASLIFLVIVFILKVRKRRKRL